MNGSPTSSCVQEVRRVVRTVVRVTAAVLWWSRVRMEGGAWLESSAGVLAVVTGNKDKIIYQLSIITNIL